MMQSLESFLVQAVRTAFEDLDIFCQASLRVSKKGMELHPEFSQEDFEDDGVVVIIQWFGKDKHGAIFLPVEAALCLGASMMLLPKEHIRELMRQRQITEDDKLTIHEVGNLLTGSLARVMREKGMYFEDIRLEDVLSSTAGELAALPFLGSQIVSLSFELRTDRGDPFVCQWCIPKEVARHLSPKDRLFVESLNGSAEQPNALGGSRAVPYGGSVSGGPRASETGDALGIAQAGDATLASPSSSLPTQEAARQPADTAVAPSPKSSAEAQGGRREAWATRMRRGAGEGGSDVEEGSQKPAGGVPRSSVTPSGERGVETRRGQSPGVKSNVRAIHDLLEEPSRGLASSSSLTGVHVLVVDDSWVARRTLAGLLKPHGCVIHDARDTRVARQVLRDHPIDLILLDLLFPGESGLSFCASLRSEGVLEYIPVVVVSGVSTSDNVVQAVRAGASFFLVKPVNGEYLIRVIRGVLRQYRTSMLGNSAG